MDLNAVARSRCLIVLSVLSGEVPVSDAIAEAKISRALYYQLETKALNAMLAALSPLASRSAKGTSPAARVTLLEDQVKRLEQDKRRMQRLLLLTRKSIRAPVALPRHGRPLKTARPGLTLTTKRRLPSSKAKATPSTPSTPTSAGASAP